MNNKKLQEDLSTDYYKIVEIINSINHKKQMIAAYNVLHNFDRKYSFHFMNYRISDSIHCDFLHRSRELSFHLENKRKEIIKVDVDIPKPNNKEYILCATILYKDTIVSGYRHSDCYEVLRTLNVDDKDLPGREHQGFLTSTNRYVDRKEAWKIAKENNQIKYGLKASDKSDDAMLNGLNPIFDDSILISENLY